MPWPCGAGTTGPRFMGLKCPTWMPTGRWSWTISCRAGFKRGQLPGSCTPLIPVAQNSSDNSGTSPSNPFQKQRTKWQQRPETPALICRIHTSSSHLAPHQCSDSAEEWIRPASNHPLRRRTAPPATPVPANSPATQGHQRDGPTFLMGNRTLQRGPSVVMRKIPFLPTRRGR